MNFSLTPAFTEADFQKEIDAFLNRIVHVIGNEVEQLALEIISDARLKTAAQGGFNDDTGNLRSSIGYLLLYDGQTIHEDFQESNQGSDRATGIELGRSRAKTIAADNPEGWAVVIVAGMEYASWVEAMGFTVITGSTLGMDVRLNKALHNVLRAFE